jgi:hypothetical protein
MSYNPLNSPGVRVILLDGTIRSVPAGSGGVPEPFRTPFQNAVTPLLTGEWEVDPQMLAEWEVSTPFSFCDPAQWQDSDLNSPPVPWELVTPGSNAYEWDETNLFVSSDFLAESYPITYIGNDALPASLEIFYTYNSGGAFGPEPGQISWHWLDSSDVEIDTGLQVFSEGTGSVVIGPPPVGAVTMQFKVYGPFFWGMGSYGTYLALGCTDAVWTLLPEEPPV